MAKNAVAIASTIDSMMSNEKMLVSHAPGVVRRSAPMVRDADAMVSASAAMIRLVGLGNVPARGGELPGEWHGAQNRGP